MCFYKDNFIKTILAQTLIVLVLVIINGCAMVSNRGLELGYDELQAIAAINELVEKYPYIDFVQIFPDTYRFELSNDQAFDKIIKQLSATGETIIKQDRKKGIIFTGNKDAPIPDQTDDSASRARVLYVQSIYLTPKNSNITYVTNYPKVYNEKYHEVVVPAARNMLRGIFFGSLAAEIYPDLRREGRKDRKGAVSNSDIENKSGATVHIVQEGETLGDIAKEYTGKLMNYKKIAEFNNIKDATKIRVGQEIMIPPGMN